MAKIIVDGRLLIYSSMLFQLPFYSVWCYHCLSLSCSSMREYELISTSFPYVHKVKYIDFLAMACLWVSWDPLVCWTLHVPPRGLWRRCLKKHHFSVCREHFIIGEYLACSLSTPYDWLQHQWQPFYDCLYQVGLPDLCWPLVWGGVPAPHGENPGTLEVEPEGSRVLNEVECHSVHLSNFPRELIFVVWRGTVILGDTQVPAGGWHSRQSFCGST